jgi:hypothetical protein
MYTAHIGNGQIPLLKKGEQVFVIGVKAYHVPASSYSGSYESNRYDLDQFLNAHPDLKLVKRMPEVVNPRYYAYSHSQHMLQPAILERI